MVKVSLDERNKLCPACEEVAAADWAAEEQTGGQIDHIAVPRFRNDISALVTQSVKSGGPDYPQVQLTLNRQMGIHRRGDATAEQLHRGRQ